MHAPLAEPAKPVDPQPWTAVIVRAMFLASSWTWVIGMFFPMYLIDDFGFAGWLAFAVPNVIGAAAMGVILRRRWQSEAIVEEHERAMRAFSCVTVAFHVGFIAWSATSLFDIFREVVGTAAGPLIAAIVFLAGWGLSCLSWSALFRAGAAAWLISAGFMLLASQTSWGVTLRLPPEAGFRPLEDLLPALPALCLGFACCPFLDLSFHRVRQMTPGPVGSASFILGFGVFFLAMISATALYATDLARGSYSYYTMGHVLLQSVFTIAVHLRCLCPQSFHARLNQARPRPRLAPWAAALSGVALLAALLGSLPEYREGYSASRLAYELALSCYGLVFPVYVVT